MKKIALSFLILFTGKAFAVCSSPIIRTSVGASSVLTSTRYNADVNTAYNRVNNLPGDCIIDESITAAKLASGSVTTAKIADGAITSAKVASGAIPEVGRLIRITAFTSSGTWTRQSDVGSIYVQLVGGGGASYHSSGTSGGNTTFGGHCTGNGGTRASTSGDSQPGGAGGTAANGDINITGANGAMSADAGHGVGGIGGVSMMGHFGMGGSSGGSPKGGGGGAGGYCAKFISVDDLNSTETVTIGAGGTSPASLSTNGNAGFVLIYEYSL
jgi:hypothetical protein